MPIDAPNNCWTYAEEALRTYLPELLEFRLFTGAADAAAAAAFVHMEARSLEGNTQTAWVEISSATKNGYGRFEARAGQDEWGSNGILTANFCKVATIADNWAQTNRKIKNHIGTILEQLRLYIKQYGGLSIREVKVIDGPTQTPEHRNKTAGDVVRCEVQFTWRSE